MWKTSLQANYYKNDIKAQCWAQFTTQGGKIRLEVNLMMKQTGGQGWIEQFKDVNEN